MYYITFDLLFFLTLSIYVCTAMWPLFTCCLRSSNRSRAALRRVAARRSTRRSSRPAPSARLRSPSDTAAAPPGSRLASFLCSSAACSSRCSSRTSLYTRTDQRVAQRTQRMDDHLFKILLRPDSKHSEHRASLHLLSFFPHLIRAKIILSFIQCLYKIFSLVLQSLCIYLILLEKFVVYELYALKFVS